MAKNTEKLNDEIDEAFAPLLSRVTLCVSHALGVAPVRLRRARVGWRLAVSSPLVTLQRLIAVITSITGVASLILDFLTDNNHRIRVGKTKLAGYKSAAEICLTVIANCLVVLNASERVKRLVTVLQQIHKIKVSLKMSSSRIKYYRLKHILLVFYITWQIVTYLVSVTGFIYKSMKDRQASVLVCCFCVTSFYQGLGIAFLQLQWSAVLVDIHSTLTLVNDKLEILLTNMRRKFRIKDLKTCTRNSGTSVQDNKNTVIATRLGFRSVRSIHLSYDTICNILRELGNESGPFLLVDFLLLFLHLLITPYNLLIVVFDNRESGFFVAEQANWCLLHFCQLVSLVEPCHWILDQRERTKRLLSGLAFHASHRKDTAQLKTFLQQVQLLDFTMAPCDVFTISRPLLASVIGGVATYLIIIVQFQTIPELI